jgi:hypothetical protein
LQRSNVVDDVKILKQRNGGQVGRLRLAFLFRNFMQWLPAKNNPAAE